MSLTINKMLGESTLVDKKDVVDSFVARELDVKGDLYFDYNLGSVWINRSIRASGSIVVSKGTYLHVDGDILAGNNIVTDEFLGAEGKMVARNEIRAKQGLDARFIKAVNIHCTWARAGKVSGKLDGEFECTSNNVYSKVITHNRLF